jgi:S-adenosylmethionine hydrolase
VGVQGKKKPKPIVALITDFGTRDWFVGTMKGVIMSIAPEVRILDITHEIAPQSLGEGAFALVASYRYFPAGTVFCVVVDPGVGSEREAIVASDGKYYFVAPNNGVLSFVKSKSKRWQAYRIENKEYVLPRVSSTFHARDVFAPAVAHLVRNKTPRLFGAPVKDFVTIPFPKPEIQRGKIRGEVIYIDRFGNLITNILPKDVKKAGIERVRKDPFRNCLIYVGRKRIIGISKTYADVASEKALAYWGSSEYLEIAVRAGSAVRFFTARLGTSVSIEAY